MVECKTLHVKPTKYLLQNDYSTESFSHKKFSLLEILDIIPNLKYRNPTNLAVFSYQMLARKKSFKIF